jgi:hypothetical protein
MASKKEEKERLRAAREAAEAKDRKQERKQLILGYAVAGVITAAVLVGIVIAITSGGGDEGSTDAPDTQNANRINTAYGSLPKGIQVDDRDAVDAPTEGNTSDLQAAAEAANCELDLDQKDEGNTHLAENADVPDYEANPPTSGDHSPNPLADGAFLDTPSPLNYVHALEHGRIEIQYHSDLPEEEQKQLLGLFDQAPDGMIMFPNDDQPDTIAVTAWTQTMRCDKFEGAATLDAIRAFRSAYLARGPEPIAMG